MMNDQASDDEEDSDLLRKQRKSLFGFQVMSAKMMRESMLAYTDGDSDLMNSLLPSCIGGRASGIQKSGLKKRKKDTKFGNCLGKDNTTNGKEGINIFSSDDSDEEQAKPKINIKKDGEVSSEESDPEEFDVVNQDGSVTRMIVTASGPIPLDFSNTKIIQDGKVFNINDLSAFSAAGNNNQESSVQPGMGDAAGVNANRMMASFNKDGTATSDTYRNYATDIGLFKAGMDTIDQNEVKKVIQDSSSNSEFFKTQETKLR